MATMPYLKIWSSYCWVDGSWWHTHEHTHTHTHTHHTRSHTHTHTHIHTHKAITWKSKNRRRINKQTRIWKKKQQETRRENAQTHSDPHARRVTHETQNLSHHFVKITSSTVCKMHETCYFLFVCQIQWPVRAYPGTCTVVQGFHILDCNTLFNSVTMINISHEKGKGKWVSKIFSLWWAFLLAPQFFRKVVCLWTMHEWQGKQTIECMSDL